jgi:TRIAD3 protein (E3 ubiquitin-protein ligase RNF216)
MRFQAEEAQRTMAAQLLKEQDATALERQRLTNQLIAEQARHRRLQAAAREQKPVLREVKVPLMLPRTAPAAFPPQPARPPPPPAAAAATAAAAFAPPPPAPPPPLARVETAPAAAAAEAAEAVALSLLAGDPESELMCTCCFTEYRLADMSQCSEGCLFCNTCVQGMAQVSIFGEGARKLKCLNASLTEPCPGVVTEKQLRRVLPPEMIARYDERLQEEALAGFADIVKCHKCEFRFALDADEPAERDPTAPPLTFMCPAPGCGARTCRGCGKAGHGDVRCDMLDGVDGARKTLEEAATEALVRVCPGCKARFYKTEGCNKMACPRCGKLSCYVCRQDITKKGYAHFCQAPHCKHGSCGKCVLFTDTDTDNAAAMRAAVERAAQQVVAVRPDLAGSDVMRQQVAAVQAPPPPPPPPPTVAGRAQGLVRAGADIMMEHLRMLQVMAAQGLGRRRGRARGRGRGARAADFDY